MRDVPSWDQYFMTLATGAALRSKDPNTQVGAIIVDPNRTVVITGFNGFAPGVPETPARWERPYKYDRVIHAEVNAIGRAARAGRATDGATMYCTHFPCNKNGCARLIIAAGIHRVVAGASPDGWDDDHILAREMLDEAGVDWEIIA